MEDYTSLLDTAIVPATKYFPLMDQNTSDRDTPFREALPRFIDGYFKKIIHLV